MDFTAIKYLGQGSFTVKKGTIDILLFLLKTIGIYPKQVSMILWYFIFLKFNDVILNVMATSDRATVRTSMKSPFLHC